MAREVGTEGKLGGQAQVKNVAGIWKALTDNVNVMASNVRRLCYSFLSLYLICFTVDEPSAGNRNCHSV